jgi:Cdc6-like AAA superfamily ATPase
MEGPTSTLLCPGIPGAGKTFMTAIVVDYLCDQLASGDTGVAVLYCSYKMREQQNARNLLAGLLKQLVGREHSLSPPVQDLFARCEGGRRQPTFRELSSLLHEVASTYRTSFILIDALDECDSAEWSALLSELHHLQALLPSVRLMVTFRPHVTLGIEFTGALILKICASNHDIEIYIKGQLSRLSKFVQLTAGLSAEITHGVITSADGM